MIVLIIIIVSINDNINNIHHGNIHNNNNYNNNNINKFNSLIIIIN